MSLSYKDALLLGKTIDSQVKYVAKKAFKVFSTAEIKKMCMWGKLDELKQVNPNYFSKNNIDILISIMHDKLTELEIWKYEDQNQYEDIQKEFNERTEGIAKCMIYVNDFNIDKNNNESDNNI